MTRQGSATYSLLGAFASAFRRIRILLRREARVAPVPGVPLAGVPLQGSELILVAGGPASSRAKVIPFPHAEKPSAERPHRPFEVPRPPPRCNSKVPSPAAALPWIGLR